MPKVVHKLTARFNPPESQVAVNFVTNNTGNGQVRAAVNGGFHNQNVLAPIPPTDVHMLGEVGIGTAGARKKVLVFHRKSYRLLKEDVGEYRVSLFSVPDGKKLTEFRLKLRGDVSTRFTIMNNGSASRNWTPICVRA